MTSSTGTQIPPSVQGFLPATLAITVEQTTDIATLPDGAERSFKDLYAEKRRTRGLYPGVRASARTATRHAFQKVARPAYEAATMPNIC